MRARRTPQGTITALSALVRLNSTLVELDVSCNAGFGPDGCEQLRRAIEQNVSIMRADIRQCGGCLGWMEAGSCGGGDRGGHALGPPVWW